MRTDRITCFSRIKQSWSYQHVHVWSSHKASGLEEQMTKFLGRESEMMHRYNTNSENLATTGHCIAKSENLPQVTALQTLRTYHRILHYIF